MSRLTDRNDWFEIWFEDKNSIIEIMLKNMKSDLDAGYDYFGKSITEQRQMIDEYKAKFDAQMEEFKIMDEKQANRWCYYDMKRRGVIE